MINIKNSFADCSSCEIFDNPSCLLETNCENLNDVDIVFIAENPGKNEIKEERPLVGRSGKIFRRVFNSVFKNKCNWLITNTVLCSTIIHNKTENPSDKTLQMCKVNCQEIIKKCNPKLVVLMGTTPMKAFDIAESGITTKRRNYYTWHGYNIFLTVHPSYVNRNMKKEFPEYVKDLEAAAEYIGIENIESLKYEESKYEKQEIKKGEKGIFRYTIPEKYYEKKYRLIDVQYQKEARRVMYIFRDDKNKKVIHTCDNTYVAYVAKNDVDPLKIVKFDKLNQVHIPYEQRYDFDPLITYEGDNPITSKHAVDYYYFSKEESQPIQNNIFFLDIEIDMGKDNSEFPNPTQANFPISMISCSYNNEVSVFVLDNHTEKINDIDGVNIKIAQNERIMLESFIRYFRECDPDISTGWNSIGFDFEYLYNRFPKVRIDGNHLSKYGKFVCRGESYYCRLDGCVQLDMLYLYKSFTFGKRENYKLGTIANIEIGMTKIDLDLPINRMYWEKLNTLIKYNVRDTKLLVELEDKIKHINLSNEIRKLCNTSYECALSVLKQIDSLVISYLKNDGFACKNLDPSTKKEAYPGAYVLAPTPALYNYVADFDFSSLYPSLFITYNIGINTYVMQLCDSGDTYNYLYDKQRMREMVEVIENPVNHPIKKKISREEFDKYITDHNYILTINGSIFKNHTEEMSVYSIILDQLLESRKVYKSKMFDAQIVNDTIKYNLFKTKQLVYKVIANSMYGAIGNEYFRFFNVNCAGAITMSGQEALKTAIIEGNKFTQSIMSNSKEYEKPKQLSRMDLFDSKNDTFSKRGFPYIVTGDTDSIFCTFEKYSGKLTTDKMSEMCQEIQSFLNGKILRDLTKRHNVAWKMNRLNLKNELIIRRGLFLAKKRYAIYVITNEGKEINEITYMGLEIKRSDFPSASKEFLKNLLDIILKSDNFSLKQLMAFIKLEKKEFVTMIKNGDKRIARPVSYTKRIEQYKKIPQGVLAMEAWNSLFYKCHVPGCRAYMFKTVGFDEQLISDKYQLNFNKYINKNKKLNLLAIPDEEACLPKCIIPDVKAMLTFSFTDRYESLLKPIIDISKNEGVLTF